MIFTTWLWGDGYGEHYVRKLAAAIRRHATNPRIICFVDRFRPLLENVVDQPIIVDLELTKIKGCFTRLRLFDPEMQKLLGIAPGERVVNLDLDLVVTGDLDWMDEATAPFAILRDINSTNPCPFNGSVWSFVAGDELAFIWNDFSVENYHKLGVPFHAFPDDQGWLYHCIPGAAAYGPHCGVYGFRKRGWPKAHRPGEDLELPGNAKIVAFPGWRDPSKFEDVPWIREAWSE